MDTSYIDELQPGSLIKSRDISYAGTLRRIRKAKAPYQAIWEAITNAFESIRDSKEQKNHSVEVRFYYTTELLKDIAYFDRIEIEDTGIGFTDKNFDRFLRINDDSKGFRNRGSGRIQLLHVFKKSLYTSIFEEKGKYKKRKFIFSKDPAFLDHNAIVRYIGTTDSTETESHTILSCSGITKENSAEYEYQSIDAEKFKKILKDHYLPFFCSYRESIPLIKIVFYKNNQVDSSASIDSMELPMLDKDLSIDICYSQYDKETKIVKKLSASEKFRMRCFKIGADSLSKNQISIVCKEEVVPDIKLKLDLLNEHDSIDGNRYLIFVSGDYLDKIVGDTRGELFLPEEKDIKTDDVLCNEKTIVLDDINARTNLELKKQYPEIAQKEKEYRQDLLALSEMFLLNEQSVQRLSAKLGINASPQSFLQKVYEIDSEHAAKVDSKIKENLDSLAKIDPSASDYHERLNSVIGAVVRAVPLQNRTDITHYVARRRLVLDLFDKALHHQLAMQKDPIRKIDEKILHNILFQQTSNNPEDSDLWLLNEDFIYFKGASENRLSDVTIDGEKLFKNGFSEEEEIYLHSLGEDRTIKRPDVLLFPEEGKCIIIEFKNPDVNVAKHLTQINMYAGLVLQFSSDKFPINTFYGYLIGENILSREVRLYDGDFREASKFDFLFRPMKVIPGENRPDGALYTEVIKYSTLLKRACARNDIFIKKLSSLNPHIKKGKLGNSISGKQFTI